MEPWNERSRCVKCGNPQAKSKYIKSHAINDGIYNEFDTILRTCTNCGYFWNELPLDAKEDETT